MTSLRQAIQGLRRGATHAGESTLPAAGSTDRERVEAAIKAAGWHPREGSAARTEPGGEYVDYHDGANQHRVFPYYRNGTELAWAAWNDDPQTNSVARHADWPPGLTAQVINYICAHHGPLKAAS